jgi:hypothetical protein
MVTLSAKEFIEKLKSNNLKSATVLKGIVKKSESDTEVLFAGKGDFGNWIKIPSSMIEEVTILNTFTKENETFAVVKLHLKASDTPEGKIFNDLTASMGKDEMCGRGWGHHGHGAGHFGLGSMFKKYFGHHMGSYCEQCGCGTNCTCGCHKQNYAGGEHHGNM